MSTPIDPIVIVATQRTPIGQFQGALATLHAPKLASSAIAACLSAISLSPSELSEVFIGCVLPAGIGQAPARQAAIGAGVPYQVGATTINKMCGSGMKALMLAHDLLIAGNGSIILAGGMESMSNAPYLLPKARAGYRMGHGTIIDHMFLDGLEDAYEKGKLMGFFAEKCAEKYQLTRQSQDAFALTSLTRAKTAIREHYFSKEIVPIILSSKNGQIIIDHDELPEKADPAKIPTLKPAFKDNGTVTAANASAISDGAAMHILMRKRESERRNLVPLATMVGHATHSQEPAWYATAPISAIQKLLTQINWRISDVDLFEINEAFAVVVLAAMKELAIPLAKINIHGGACAMGHPIGASGARIVTTLIYALKRMGYRRGVAALCIGGGEATALAIEVAP